MSDAPDGLSLAWSLTPADGGLALAYTLTNRGTAPVWALDRLLAWAPTGGLALVPERVAVRSGAPGAPLRLVRGHLRPLGHRGAELFPVAREVPPGGSVSGTARLPLPLRSWSPNESASDVLFAPDLAVLEVGVIPEAPDDERSLATGDPVPVPSTAAARSQRFVRGAPLAWPPGG